jgi:DNA invertase Pin-like site-specific DNA recombinase
MQTNNKFGYIRVSTQEQNDDRQRIALEPFNIPTKNLYVDKQSGKNFDRTQYKKLLKKLSYGDVLYIKSIDRMGRNYNEIIDEWRTITREKGTDIKIIDMPLLDTTYYKDLLGTFIADLVLQVLSFVAQIERENIIQRQAEGIAAVKAKGFVFGKKPSPLPENFDELYIQWRDGILNAEQIAQKCNFSRRTLYEKTKEIRKRDGFVYKCSSIEPLN